MEKGEKRDERNTRGESRGRETGERIKPVEDQYRLREINHQAPSIVDHVMWEKPDLCDIGRSSSGFGN